MRNSTKFVRKLALCELFSPLSCFSLLSVTAGSLIVESLNKLSFDLVYFAAGIYVMSILSNVDFIKSTC